MRMEGQNHAKEKNSLQLFLLSLTDLTAFSLACSKEFFNVTWNGVFVGEYATQDCPRGGAGNPEVGT